MTDDLLQPPGSREAIPSAAIPPAVRGTFGSFTRYIDGFYNAPRRYSALDFISPIQFERLAANWSNAFPLN